MYTRFAERRGWQVEVIAESTSELGGYKEAIVRIVGDGAYSALKFESGGHRVQRVPETEASGRIHTSTVTVAAVTVSPISAWASPSTTCSMRAADMRGRLASSPGRSISTENAMVLRQSAPVSGLT